MTPELLEKYEHLKAYLQALDSVAVAFSSGVDSTFLLYAAKEALQERVVAVTAKTCSLPDRELQEATAYCNRLHIQHFVVETDELQMKEFVENPPNRCYICKHRIFERMREFADKQGIRTIVEGSNLDDEGDYRPGLQALSELQIVSPLRKIGFTKKEIRELSEYLQIPTWDKKSFACLATRIPYGEMITKEKLEMVDQAEQLLFDLGFKQFRVRAHGNLARIELEPKDFNHFMDEEIRKKVYYEFKSYGFSYVALDIVGYRTGAMNEVLPQQ